jgi:hypothetical protein
MTDRRSCRGDAKRKPAGLSRGEPAQLFALRYATACDARKDLCFACPAFRFAQSGLKPRPTSLLKVRKRALGNVPGYYRSSLAGLRCCRRGLVVFLDAVRRGHPAATPGCLFFCCAGATRYGRLKDFRAAGLHDVTAGAKAGCFMTPTAGIT